MEKNDKIRLCLNFSSTGGYYYTVDPPVDDCGQVDYSKFAREELFDLPEGIRLNIADDGLLYFYDIKTGVCMPSYELITIDNIPAIVVPSESPGDFITLRFQRA